MASCSSAYLSPQSFAAFFSERLSDLFAVVLLSLFDLTLYPEARPMIVVGAGLVVAGFLLPSQRRLIERLAKLLPEHKGKHLAWYGISFMCCWRPSAAIGPVF